MATRKTRTQLTASELLSENADALEFLGETFPDLDLALEAHKCTAYWNAKGGFSIPRLAFANWIEKAATLPRRYGIGAGVARPAPARDRNEYLRDFEQRRRTA